MIGKKNSVVCSDVKFILAFIMSLIISPPSHSQKIDLQFEHFSVDEGMPTVVNHILQDKIGFLWFATNSGLYKYDGYSFTSYNHDIDDSASLIDNTITTLYEDKGGTLWAGTWVGLEKFNRIKNTFTHYKLNPSDTGDNASNNVWTICEDKYEMLWVGTGDGLFKFDKVKERFISLRYDSTDPGSISHNGFGAILEDKEGNLWFGTQVGLDKFDFKTGKFIHHWIDQDNRYKTRDFGSKYRINGIFEDEAGILWLGTNKGLVEYNTKENTFSTYIFILKDSVNRITSISQDVITGSLWLATWNGLYSFDKNSKKFTRYNSEANYVLSERSGTLWIGTNTEVKKVNRIKQPFNKYQMNDIALAVSNGNTGTLWIFTYNGWKKFDIAQEQFVQYSFGKGSLFYVWNSDHDMSIRKDKSSLYVQDTIGNVTFSLDPSRDWEVYINSASFGWKGKKGYWGGFNNGDLDFWDPKTNRVIKIQNFKQRIYWIYEDSFGLLWIATYMGKLFCYDQEKDASIEFISDFKNPSSISGKVISNIFEDKKGRLWFATNNGLNEYERSTNTFIHFSEKEGLPNNNVLGILEDDIGCLWLNTSKGISKFNPETKHFKNYDASYGLEITADAWYGVGCKTKNGEMYFAGARGFTRFNPDSIKDNPFLPPIVITSVRKFDKPFSISDPSRHGRAEASEIHLPYDENFISFEFAALSYISPERNQYAYMMEGLDKDWVYSGTRRYASYPNLSPGEYIFRVKGSNNDGVWNEAGTSIAIIIYPPWWKTTLAYILYSILILSLIYFTWKMQMRRIRLSHEYEMTRFESEKLHEIDEMKSKFFANISHEFRTPLTMVLGPVKQIIETIKDGKTRLDNNKLKNELKVVHRNANRLLTLVNQLLDISKLESGNMKLQTRPQNIIPLLKALLQSFCSYAERKRITLKFNSAEDEIIVYIDKDKIEKIITNILSNASKFTPEGGLIEVSIIINGSRRLQPAETEKRNLKVTATTATPFSHSQLIGDFLEITIRDTGIGIPKEKVQKIFDRFYQVDGSHTREMEGTGIGLSLTKELVELHQGKIEVESEENRGTTFTISIPLGKEHLKPEEICETEMEKEKVSTFPDELIYVEETKKDDKDFNLIDRRDKPYLLIVEDNSDVRNYIKSNLEKDYRILEAFDGEDGLKKSIDSATGGPDLIVSDVMMPKMDGFKLCEKLKTDERTSHIPVILLTAKASSKDKIEGLETGADDYIMKPFEPEELKVRIKNLIEQRIRIHEHFKKQGLFELEQTKITSVDKKFLQKTFDVINLNISNVSFSLELFAENLNISKSLLHKKIVALTGEPPGELIRRIRLKKAAELIENKFGNISEIALEVGFNNPAYFSECFKKQFGVSPSHYHN